MAKRNIGATLSLRDANFVSTLNTAASKLSIFKSKTESATKSAKSFGSGMDKAGAGLKSMAKNVVGAIAAYVSVREVVNFGKECVEAMQASEAESKRLETTILNVTGNTKEQVSALKEYAKERMNTTSIDDEATMRGMSQLGTFQLQSDTIKKLVPAMQDLAVAQYGVAVSEDQMQSMANLMGKVMTGNASALTRYGVTMNETQKKILQTGTESERAAMLVEVLGQNFGGLAEQMAGTGEGRVQQLKNAWGEVKEMVGEKLYPIVTQVLTSIAGHLSDLEGFLGPVVDKIGDGLSSAFSFAKETAKSFFDDVKGPMQTIAGESAPAIKEAFSTAFSTIGDVIQSTLKFFADALNKGDRAKNIGKMLKNIFTAIGAAIKVSWAIVKPILGFVIDLIFEIIDAIAKTVNAVADAISKVKDKFGTMVDWVKEKVDKIKEFFSSIGTALSDAFTGSVDKVKEIINGIIGFLNKGLEKIVGGLNKLASPLSKLADKMGITIPTFTVPQIPLLANGGVITGAGAAIVGENGPELLSLNRGATVQPLSRAENRTNNNTFNITINADGKSVSEIIGELIPPLKLALSNL